MTRSSTSSSQSRLRSDSEQSSATYASFATAHDEFVSTPAAASFYVDSSDDDDDDGAGAFRRGRDPLAAASPANATARCDEDDDTTPPDAARTATDPTRRGAAPPGHKFDVAQHAYGTAKRLWARGRTVPGVAALLGLSEAVAATVLAAALRTDLPAVDQEAVTPGLKRLDDDLLSPVIAAVWRVLGPAWSAGEERVVRPVLAAVVPRVLGPVGVLHNSLDGRKKKRDEEEQRRKAAMEEKAIDSSPTRKWCLY